MGPKKKGGGKKKGAAKKKKEEPEVKEVSEYEGMDLEMLQEVTPMLRQQLEKTQLDRNYVQLERDTIQTFYDISKKESHDYDQAIAAKDREMEIMEENHRTEVRVYVQKVKHLEYEHKNNVKRVELDGKGRLQDTSELHEQVEDGLRQTKTSLRLELKERELSNEDEIDQMAQAHEKNLSKLREEFDKNLAQLEARCAEGVTTLGADLELRRKVELHEIEERKNLHIRDLMNNHASAFGQIKQYYNDITTDNLRLIQSLKDELLAMKTKAMANTKLMYDISQENKRLSDPLTVAIHEVERLRHELKDQLKDQQSLASAQRRVQVLEKRKQELSSQHAALKAEYERTEKDRSGLYESFEQTIHSVQRKSEFKNMVLEQRLSAMTETAESKEAQLDEILRAANLDPVEIKRVTTNLESVLSSKNADIQDLKYRLSRASKAYNDTHRTLESKLGALGIPEEDFETLGFQPLMGEETSTGPAGLV